MKPLVDATRTPLSSIFGSSFLIIVPVLAGAVGSVIRFNIKHAELVLGLDRPPHLSFAQALSTTER